MASTYIGLRAIEVRVRAGLVAGVNESAEQLLPKIRARTPVLSGTLRGGEDTDHVTRASGTDFVETKVHTGPAADEYAIIQHERREGVKYVRGPLLEHITDHADIVADAVRKVL